MSPCQAPWERPKLKGTKASGLTYERAVGRHLSRLYGQKPISNQWLRFIDANGQGYAQPDHYFVFEDHVLLIECKRTQTQKGLHQIDWLYRPLLFALYGRPVIGVMACKYMYKENDWTIRDIKSLRPCNKTYTWHWLG